jgi:hypothetical protein
MLLLDRCPVLEGLQISYIDIVKSIDQFDFEHFENSSNRFLILCLSTCYNFVYDFPTFHNLI